MLDPKVEREMSPAWAKLWEASTQALEQALLTEETEGFVSYVLTVVGLREGAQVIYYAIYESLAVLAHLAVWALVIHSKC